MRNTISFINRKVAALLGTTEIKQVSEKVKRLEEINEHVLIGDYLHNYLFQNEIYLKSKKITHYYKGVFAQNGEDGVIQEIFNRIGIKNKTFVEFGAHGVKNNSTLLLIKGWKGLWIGGNSEGEKTIKTKFRQLIESKRLAFKREWITKDNIEEIFAKNEVPSEFDFLSIDLDGNDYWIWDAIVSYKPRVVCIEYNASFPPDVSWVMKYNPMHVWDQTNYFGASLKALEKLGKKKGYELIGCDFAGCNAFFARNDEDLSGFEEPFTAEHHYEPPRYFLRKPNGHPKNFGDFEIV